MGTVLKVLGVLFLLLVVGFVALLMWSHGKGESTQEDFFAAVLSGDPDRLYGMFDPGVQAEIDTEVLAVWMAAIRENLGEFKGLKGSNFSTSSKVENGVTVVETEGTAEFEKGEARSELTVVDGKIRGFSVTSDALPDPWFTELPDSRRYVELGRECLEKLMTGDIDGATALMHEGLREVVEPEKMRAGMERLRALTGDLVEIEKADEVFEAKEPPVLRLRYRVAGQASEVLGDVRFDFTPWKGHLRAFKLPVD